MHRTQSHLPAPARTVHVIHARSRDTLRLVLSLVASFSVSFCSSLLHAGKPHAPGCSRGGGHLRSKSEGVVSGCTPRS
eukprot:6257463-Pyramimonas_sp.AAC.1